MEKYKLTVGVITYNHGDYIKHCIDSIFEQVTNFKFKVVVAEDCSTDNTREVLLECKKKYGDDLILILNEHNLGPSQNSRQRYKYYDTEYVCGIEGDDYLCDKYAYQKQIDFLEKNKEYVAVGCNIMGVDFKENETGVSLSKFQVNKKYTLNTYLKHGFEVHCNTIMQRNVIPYSDEKYKKLVNSSTTMGDIKLLCLLYDKGPIFVLKDVMYCHRAPAPKDIFSYSLSSKTRLYEYNLMYEDIVVALGEYFNASKKYYPLLANRISQAVFLDNLLGIIKVKDDLKYEEWKEHYKKYPLNFRILCRYKVVYHFFRKVINKLARMADRV